MSMLAFMPWCGIDKAYTVGGVRIIPYQRHKPNDGQSDDLHCQVDTILATYKSLRGKPVEKAALVCYDSGSPTDNLSRDQMLEIQEFMALACFSGLAKREYFNPLGPYCNTECFALYFQKFEKTDFTAIATRRREGRYLSGWPIDEIALTIPISCHGIEAVTLDEALLVALGSHRQESGDQEWGRWQNAIICFNQANTDNDTLLPQVEWVLLCSAFEHILAADPQAKSVADEFSKYMTPAQSILASKADRRSEKWPHDDSTLRSAWMREFYRIRGDFAHGRLETCQPMIWQTEEHLVLAAIAFPLLVKCLLKKAIRYEFESLAGTRNFMNPPDQKNSLDSHWRRIRREYSSKLAVERACQAFKRLHRKEEPCEEGNQSGDNL